MSLMIFFFEKREKNNGKINMRLHPVVETRCEAELIAQHRDTSSYGIYTHNGYPDFYVNIQLPLTKHIHILEEEISS